MSSASKIKTGLKIGTSGGPLQASVFSMKRGFFLLEFDELAEILASAGFRAFRAKQVWEGVYKKKIFSFSEITNLPADLRKFLSDNFEIKTALPQRKRTSSDDTGKYLFELSDGYFIESVLLEAPEGEGDELRKTLCISTQVGCAQGCRFCASTMRGFKRNLDSSEIVSQLLPFVKNGEFEFENIVVMGMGEPLANFENAVKALYIIKDRFGFGARRITLSTCGIADKLKELAEMKFPFRLAISLHGASNDVREKIMPVNKRFPLEVLLPAAKAFAKSNGRMITLEYILIDKVNDSFSDAKLLSDIANSLHAHVNLIPYNRVEGLDWKRPSSDRRKAFFNALKSKGVSCTLRREKGSDIEAACGQLALIAERQKLENM